MKYFLIETDKTNLIPYGVNNNRAVDIRLINKNEYKKIPQWNVMTMDLPSEPLLPDLICSPCVLLSQMCMTAIQMYAPWIQYRMVKLWNRESGLNATYFIPILEEIDCLSDRTQYNTVGNRILNIVLNKDKIGSNVVFKLKNTVQNGFIGRMDFVESIIRRGAQGILLTEIEIDEAQCNKLLCRAVSNHG